MNTPILKTDRLILRPFDINDTVEVFECWSSDSDVARYMLWTEQKSVEETKEWIEFEINQIAKNDWYRFAIVLKETNELIGTAIVYFENEVNCWEIGYNLGKRYWGKGFTAEAVKRVITFVEKELRLKKIVGRYAVENKSSENVLKKLGFKFEKDVEYFCNDGKVKREGKQCRLILK